MDLGLTDRRVLVTGAHRGTGAGIAHMLAVEGAHVIVHGFEPGQPDETVASIRATGGSADGVVGEIRTDDGIAAIDASAFEVDVLVNNYGAPMGSAWGSLDEWTAEWNVNVETAVRVTQRCLPTMRARAWGRVIFLGTVGTRRPGSRNPGYYAAKTALPTLVRTLAIELRGTGVTANLVSPGMIATAEVRAMVQRRAARDGVAAGWTEAERWALDHTMPNLTERIPDPVDIGRVVAFVASEAAWHVNGADLAVDGGALDA